MSAVGADPTAALLDGRYRLIECVGEGGMARVYRDEDIILGRTVAIKLIRPGVDGASSDRARSEVTVLASLNHPSLVTLFDARLVPGAPEYLAMEYVDGPTLASRLASGGALPAETVAHLAAELAGSCTATSSHPMCCSVRPSCRAPAPGRSSPTSASRTCSTPPASPRPGS